MCEQLGERRRGSPTPPHQPEGHAAVGPLRPISVDVLAPGDPAEKTRVFFGLQPARVVRSPEPISSEGCVCRDIQVTRLGNRYGHETERRPGESDASISSASTSTRSEHLQCARARVNKKTLNHQI